ncbi:MAG TPA: hypothetical protein VHE35_10690, partial [Kofleriaceae bacterium]|nr:hypothetical protein [Kofleriaceae bacterium]
GSTTSAGAGAAAPVPGHALADTMITPRCLLGPADLCATIADTVDACDAGDGQACLAVGQFLEDEPPRPLVLVTFYALACKDGEQAGCDRETAIKSAAALPRPCADDPVACAWAATQHGHDEARLDEACSLGVADACADLLEHVGDDPVRERAYLETACQAGSPMACAGLARALAPSCANTAGEGLHCLPRDPEVSGEASTMACEVGFTDLCQ